MLDLYIFPLYRVVDPLQPELPGLLVLPPQKADGRGRENDLLILYLTLNRPDAYTSIALKQMLQAAAALYFKTHGTVTAGLRDMADHLNGILLERNLRSRQEGEPVVAMCNLVAMRDDMIYLAQAGPTHSIFINAEVVQDYSDTLTSGRGLGAASALNLKYYQVQAAAGDVFVMAPNPPEAWTHEALTGSHQLTLEHLRKRLLNQADPDLQAVVVKFQPGQGQVHLLRPRGSQPAAPVIPSLTPAQAPVLPSSQAIPAAPIPAPDLKPPSAPVVGQEAPPTIKPQAPVPPEITPIPAPEPGKPSQLQSTTTPTQPPATFEPASELPESATTTATTAAAESDEAKQVPQAVPVMPQPIPGQPLTRADRIRMARGLAVPTAAPVQKPAEAEQVVSAEPAAPAAPARNRPRPAPKPHKPSEGKRRMATTWLAVRSFFSRTGGAITKLTGRLAPEKPKAPPLPASTMLFIAIAVPAIVVTVILVFYSQFRNTDERKSYINQALEYSAAAVQQEDLTLQRNDWDQALTWLGKAEAISVTDESRSLHSRIQQGVDAIDGIVRLEYKPVVRYELPTGTKITRISATSSDIYLLDSSQGRILRLFLTGTGYELDKQFKCGPGPAGSLQVQALVDFVILPPNTRKATVLASDANGVLLYCIPGTDPYSTILTPPDAGWGKATAIALSSDTLLVLDQVNNAVWVYDGKNVEFPDAPYLFFDKDTPSLATVIDFAFYGDDIYLLHEDGGMTQCALSTAAFAPTRCKDPANYGDTRTGHDSNPLKIADASFSQVITTQPPDPSLYMLDTQGPGIYHFSLLLNFQRQLRASTTTDIHLPNSAPTAFSITPTRQAVLAFGSQVYYAQLP